ncbi:hypothetical protein BJ912DRAFT_30567 [Pholiota molesta]|nr:hypothetical protein BJ912DRAFT_30567 [Pholiota molesta]
MPSRPPTPTLPDLSSLSLSAHTVDADQDHEDWDQDSAREPDVARPCTPPQTVTPPNPRNSVAFPPGERYSPSFSPGRATRFSSGHARGSDSENEAEGDAQDDGSNEGRREGRRTLSALLRLHSERGAAGSAGRFSEAEAARIADVLGQWINSSSSPYESAADDFAFILPPRAHRTTSPWAPISGRRRHGPAGAARAFGGTRLPHNNLSHSEARLRHPDRLPAQLTPNSTARCAASLIDRPPALFISLFGYAPSRLTTTYDDYNEFIAMPRTRTHARTHARPGIMVLSDCI